MAQDAPTEAPTTAPPAEAAPTISESHRRAAERVVQLNGTQENLKRSLEITLKMQLEAAPGMVQYEDLFRAFFEKYMSYEYLKDGYIDIYARHFTEAELVEIGDFMETAAGKKLATTTPTLLQESSDLGQRVVNEHLVELIGAIRERERENASKIDPTTGQPLAPAAAQPE